MSTTEPKEQTFQAGGQQFTVCPHWGKGGHYRINPETGERESYQPDQEAAPAVPQVTETKAVTTKEKSRG